MEYFLLAFIPLFVAIDPIGTIPFFLSLTEDLKKSEKRGLILQAVGTAFILGLVFAVGGKLIFSVLGITPSDFRIAGGLLLLILSIREIFGSSVKRVPGATGEDKFIGVVPLGIPFIAGPAMLTTLLILQEEHSLGVILLALLANMFMVFLLYGLSDRIVERLGGAFAKVTAKVVAIFLAAIGVMMIRKGLLDLLSLGN